MVLSKKEWGKLFEDNSIMLIFINPKSEYRNPKQYLNTKIQIQNKYIAMYLQNKNKGTYCFLLKNILPA